MKTILRTSAPQEVKDFLVEHNNFSECIIERLVLTDYGTNFEVHFNYIWNTEGHIRANLDEPYTITLKFRLVQELHMDNALTAQMVKTPRAINWGFREVALVQLVESSTLVPVSTSFMHVVFLWEGQRRIDVTFFDFEALDGTAEQRSHG